MANAAQNDARFTLLNELAHARQGQAYYQKQVDKLTRKVEKLGIDPSGRGRRDSSMPGTPSDFWVGLLGKRPKSHQQVMDAALKALKLDDPSPETLRKLRLRWSVSLIDLVKKERIVTEGSGRDRKFSLPDGKAKEETTVTDKPTAH